MAKRILALFLAMVFVLLCSGCKGKEKMVKQTENETVDEISISSYKPDTLCPILSNNKANLNMLGIIYDGLIILTDEYVATPCLATQWVANENCLEWTLTLRKGVKWHSGEKFTAQDVVYTINQIKKSDNSAYRYNVSNINEALAVDANTVRFKLKKPSSNFVNLLYFPIIKLTEEEINLANFKPNGTGPYVFEDRNEGNVYHLVRNESWWGGKAKTPTVCVRILSGDDAALYSFGSGSIDMTSVENMDWGKVVDSTVATYTSFPTPLYNFLGINHKNKVLAMPEVRKAISLAVDREEVIDNSKMGYAKPANTPLRSEWTICANQKFDLKKNIEAARTALEKNGWEFKNNEYTKTHQSIEYECSFRILINQENTVRENIARVVSKNLEEFGIKTSIERLAYEEYEERIKSGNYDIFVGGIELSPELDFSALLGEDNMFFFKDDEMTFVMNEMQKKNSEEGLKATYAEFINLFEQVNPIIGLFFENSVMLYNKEIKKGITPTYFDIYRNIESIQKEKRQ